MAGSLSQPLVENIKDIQLSYGVANPAAPNQVARYVTASDLPSPADWANVISARICILVRSANEVADDKTSYYDCAGEVKTADDKRIYRSFRSTVVLHNRLGGA